MRIDVDPEGNPWTVADNFSIYNYDGVNWKAITGFKAKDVTVSNDSIVFAAGKDGTSIGRLVCDELGTWQLLNASSTNISAGPYSLFSFIDTNGNVYSTSKRDFN